MLLDNGLNPFSRAPMTKEELVPDDALRARIQRWKRCRAHGVPFEEEEEEDGAAGTTDGC